MSSMSIRVPATTANLGPGFDSFGMALNLYNTFTVSSAEQNQLTFSLSSSVAVPTEPQGSENVFFQAIQKVYQYAGSTQTVPTVRAAVEAHIPLGRGLGSSATAIVAGLLYANQYLEKPLAQQALLKLANEFEGHPDNVFPALLGGCVLCDDSDGLVSATVLPWPTDWQLVVLYPETQLLTKAARGVLPKEYSMVDTVYTLRKASGIVAAIYRQDADLLRQSLHDRVHQPYRGPLLPHFEMIKQSANDVSAYGTVISGSGPSVAVICHQKDAQTITRSLTDQFSELTVLPLQVEPTGATCCKST